MICLSIGNLSDDFIKLDLDFHFFFSHLDFEENFEYVKWHHRLRYTGKRKKMNRFAKEGLLRSPNKVRPICESCLAEKVTERIFCTIPRVSHLFDLLLISHLWPYEYKSTS